MIELTIKNSEGGDAGVVSVDEQALGGKVKPRLMHSATVMYQANARQGSASTKTRADIAGSTAKLYRQKGTGRARAGSRKSGVRVGGGRIFGPKPRDFGYAIPRKMRRAAMHSALLAKLKDGEVTVVESLVQKSERLTEGAAGSVAGVECKFVQCSAESLKGAKGAWDKGSVACVLTVGAGEEARRRVVKRGDVVSVGGEAWRVSTLDFTCQGGATLVLQSIKTRGVKALLERLGLGGVKVTLAPAGAWDAVARSASNLRRVSAKPAADLNARDLLVCGNLVIEKAGLDAIVGGSKAKLEASD